MHRGRNRRTRGSMMLEVVMASALAVIVLALLVSTQIHVLRNYQRTINHNTANRAAYNALREIREIAQQAVSVTVSGQHGDHPACPSATPTDDSARRSSPTMANPIFLQVSFAAGTTNADSKRAGTHAADQPCGQDAAGRALHTLLRATGRSRRRGVPCAPECAGRAERTSTAHVVRGMYPTSQRHTELRGGD
jgi:hypothetical protein